MRIIDRYNFRTSSCAALGVGLILLSIACESMPLRALRGARYYASGTESLERGDSARALEELSRAAQLVPRASEIQNHLGLAYWAEGQPEQARIAFDRAIELDCDNLAARQNRQALVEGATHGG
jgi:Flp pilus assembly protein TadD